MNLLLFRECGVFLGQKQDLNSKQFWQKNHLQMQQLFICKVRIHCLALKTTGAKTLKMSPQIEVPVFISGLRTV